MAVLTTPAQDKSDIGRGPGDKHINRATDEVHQNNACCCRSYHPQETSRPWDSCLKMMMPSKQVYPSIPSKPVFGILVSLTGSLVF